MSDIRLTTGDAAIYLNVTARTLQKWRSDKEGPKYYKPSPKLIYYFKSDLDEWIRS